jgi:glycosyltransferase involved in cell wall biosynthesis
MAQRPQVARIEVGDAEKALGASRHLLGIRSLLECRVRVQPIEKQRVVGVGDQEAQRGVSWRERQKGDNPPMEEDNQSGVAAQDAEMLPTITIVTPSLNQVAYVERTLRSVLDQGYPLLEYIVIDGGSTDGTLEILERFDSRLSYWVSEPDRGQAHAINKGLSRATGDVVGYINSDDYYLPGALAALGAAFANRDADWVVGSCRYEDANGTVASIVHPGRPVGSRVAWIRTPWYVPQASSLWRRSLFENYGPLREDLAYVFDSEYAVRLALNGILPSILDRELAVRYLHADAKSADPSQFEAEWRKVVPELEAHLRAGDRARDAYERARLKLAQLFGNRTPADERDH